MRVDQRQTRDRGERVREQIVLCGPQTQTVVSVSSAKFPPPPDLERLDGWTSRVG